MNASAMMLYVIVIIFCFGAFQTSRQFPDRPKDGSHWLICAAVFAGLILIRALNFEDALRNSLRSVAQALGEYGDRTAVQIPLAIIVLLILLAIAALFLRRWRASRSKAGTISRAQLVLIARFGLLGLVPLYALRLVSLHQIDRILYSGPLRLNWLGEAAILLMVGGSAAYFAWGKRRRKIPARDR